MSLKAFHLLFLAASTALAFGFAGVQNYRFWELGGTRTDLLLGFVSTGLGFLLLAYSIVFLKKTKHIEMI